MRWYSQHIGKWLDADPAAMASTSSTGGRDRLVPEMQRNFESTSRSELDRQDDMSLPEVAVLLEDAIDIHDRHWKIHWMLNFAQLSATLNLRAVMEQDARPRRRRAARSAPELANDRNWDSIKALWEMKEEAKADSDLSAAFSPRDSRPKSSPRCASPTAASSFIAERIKPYQREFGWHAVWSHEFIFPTVFEKMEPVVELIRGYIETDYDYPIDDGRAAAPTSTRPPREILDGLTGDELDEMRVANDVNLRMAPLTPDHHFYIDQGANAHVRLVLMAIGKKLVARGRA